MKSGKRKAKGASRPGRIVIFTSRRHAFRGTPKELSRVLRAKKMTIGELATSSPSAVKAMMKNQGLPVRGQIAERLIKQARQIYLNQRTDAVLDWLKAPKKA